MTSACAVIIILISSVLSDASAFHDFDFKRGNNQDGNDIEKFHRYENHKFGNIINAKGKFVPGLFAQPNCIPSIKDFNGTLHWNHEDQQAWGEDFPQCDGIRQSPINLRSKFITEGKDPCLVFNNYSSEHFNITLTNNGHTVNVNGPFGDGRSGSQPTLAGGPLLGTYALSSVHWHWGYDWTDGAEHAIDSRKYSMEMHFVHYNTNYSSAAEAMESGDPEGLAVIGVLFQTSMFSNSAVKAMAKTVEKALLGQLFYPIYFPLWRLLQYKTNYLTYAGSLTTPTCYEGVRWIVYETPLKISFNWIEVFRTFTINGCRLVDNFRTTQPLNGRTITRNKLC